MPGIANHKDGKNFGSQAGASMGDGRSEEGRKVVEEEIAVSPPPPPPRPVPLWSTMSSVCSGCFVLN